MSSDYQYLTGILAELARRGFGGAALTLADIWGGSLRYIPRKPRPDSPIVSIIGMDAAQALGDICGGIHVDIPRAAARYSLKRQILGAEGTTRTIARSLGCTERHVRSVKNAGRRSDDRQKSMFD